MGWRFTLNDPCSILSVVGLKFGTLGDRFAFGSVTVSQDHAIDFYELVTAKPDSLNSHLTNLTAVVIPLTAVARKRVKWGQN